MIETHIAITAIVLVSLFGLIALKLEQKATQLSEEQLKNRDLLIKSMEEKIKILNKIKSNQERNIEIQRNKINRLSTQEEIEEIALRRYYGLDDEDVEEMTEEELKDYMECVDECYEGEGYERVSKESTRDKKE